MGYFYIRSIFLRSGFYELLKMQALDGDDSQDESWPGVIIESNHKSIFHSVCQLPSCKTQLHYQGIFWGRHLTSIFCPHTPNRGMSHKRINRCVFYEIRSGPRSFGWNCECFCFCFCFLVNEMGYRRLWCCCWLWLAYEGHCHLFFLHKRRVMCFVEMNWNLIALN